MYLRTRDCYFPDSKLLLVRPLRLWALMIRLSPKDLFLTHLNWIGKAAAIACRKQGVVGAEAENFAAWIRMKLMEDDYAALRQFRRTQI